MTEPATDELIAEIERGLEGVTPGPWRIYDGCSWRRIGTSQANDCAVLAPTVASDGHPDLTSQNGDLYRNLEHIALCHPGNIAALIARIRQAEKERDEARAGKAILDLAIASLSHEIANRTRERDAALARVKVMDEALKPFAELAECYEPDEGDDNEPVWGIHREMMPTIGNLRAARAARK